MNFEWDENKRQKTLLQRGIDFIDAALVWDDPMRQERMDTRSDYGEIRHQTIGKVSLGVLFLVYTQRVYEGGSPVIRIISARPANKKEILLYESRTFTHGLAL